MNFDDTNETAIAEACSTLYSSIPLFLVYFKWKHPGPWSENLQTLHVGHAILCRLGQAGATSILRVAAAKQGSAEDGFS